jgi:hypothetical protein
VSPAEKTEADAILRPRLQALEAMSWDELDRYDEQQEVVAAPSGRRFRVVTGAFWDMDEWASGMNLYARAYAASGLRRWFPYKLWGARGGPDDPVPEGPAR